MAGYLVAAGFGLPQQVTGVKGEREGHGTPRSPLPSPLSPLPALSRPPYWAATPFALLLAAIAVLPLVPATRHWWENNLHRFFVAGGLAAVTLAYYLLAHAQPVLAEKGSGPICAQQPPGRSGKLDLTPFPQDVAPNYAQTGEVLGKAVLTEYIPFITLCSPYTRSAADRIEGDLPAHPLTNCHPCRRRRVGQSDRHDRRGDAVDPVAPGDQPGAEARRHTVIFFIFIVCNCGGCLLPLGDPPLLLGYLMGVRFLWTLALWKEWLVVNAALLAIYYVWDRFWAIRASSLPTSPATKRGSIACGWRAFGPTGCSCAAWCFRWHCSIPGKALPGTGWQPWMYLREAVQLCLVGVSLWSGRAGAAGQRLPICPDRGSGRALLWHFRLHAAAAGNLCRGRSEARTDPPWQFFWASGGLSSVLDNAPTYVVFFETAKSLSESRGRGRPWPASPSGCWRPSAWVRSSWAP